MIPIKAGVQVSKVEDVHIYLPESAISDSDQTEFVANQTFENSIIGKSDGSIIFDDILGKSDFIRTYLDCLHLLEVKTHDRILDPTSTAASKSCFGSAAYAATAGF